MTADVKSAVKIYDGGCWDCMEAAEMTEAEDKTPAEEFTIPPAQVIAEMSKYFTRLQGTRPMLNIYPADVKLSAAVRKCAAEWFGKDERMLFNADMDNFLRQLMESLADKDVNSKAIFTEIKKNAGIGYTSGGVHGRNEYSKDKSRVDGKMIRRKRR